MHRLRLPLVFLGIAILLNEEANSINELTTTFWEMAFATLEPASIASAGKLPEAPAP